MKSNNPVTRKRQRKRRKELEQAERRAQQNLQYEELAAKHSPYSEEHFAVSSCARKSRYDTEAKAIRACIKGARERGVNLHWYKCGYCGGWHITSHYINPHSN